MAKHTPTPWMLHHQPPSLRSIDGINWSIQAVDGPCILLCDPGSNKEKFKADVAFIIRAVNSHVEMIEWVRLLEKTIVYEINNSEREGDDEGAGMKRITLNLVRATLARTVGDRESHATGTAST